MFGLSRFSYILHHVVTFPSFCQKNQNVCQLKGSVKEPNILIFFFFSSSLNGVLFPMFCLLVEGECQILVF